MLETARSSKATIGIVGALFAPHTLAGRFARYGLASAGGTVIDLMAFGLLVWGGIGVGIAAASGYALGTVWHWQMTSRTVFPDRLAQTGEGRMRQQALFFATALMGLVLTTCVVKIGVLQGVDPVYAKIAAMCASFTSVWLLRLMFVFAESQD